MAPEIIQEIGYDCSADSKIINFFEYFKYLIDLDR